MVQPKKRNTRKPLVGKPLNQVQKKQVKKMIKGTGETKRASYYQSWNDGTNPLRPTGFIANAGWANQNNFISNNDTDILRLVPQVLQGIDDFSRIGNRITVRSLTVKGHIRVALGRMNNQVQSDIRVCLFVLQHAQLKDYEALYAANDFKQLLDNQEGGTVGFNGQPINEHMRVADQYYKVCHRKIITLRYSGTAPYPVGGLPPQVSGGVSQANAHNYLGTYSINLTKDLPKVLKFPESSNGQTPEFGNAPSNSSLFMCMGFVDQQSVSNFNGITEQGGPEPVKGWMQQTYVSYLTYKDM